MRDRAPCLLAQASHPGISPEKRLQSRLSAQVQQPNQHHSCNEALYNGTVLHGPTYMTSGSRCCHWKRC